MRQSSILLTASTDVFNFPRLQSESILKSEHYTEMGERIKAFRSRSNLTLEQAAERLGVSVTTIKLLERGKSLTMENAMRICFCYGCTIAEIFPNEFIEYTSPFANVLSQITERQRESIRNSFDRF